MTPSTDQYPSAPQLMGISNFPGHLVGSSNTDAYTMDTQLMSSPSNGGYLPRTQPWETSASGANVMSSPSTTGYYSGPPSPSTTRYLLKPQLVGGPDTPQQSPPSGLSSPLFASRPSLQASKCIGD